MMPPEWAKQRSMWFSWAHNQDTWPNHLDQVQIPYSLMVAEFSRVQRVDINVPSKRWEEEARKSLIEAKADFSNVFFHQIPTNDSWIRDHGPVFLLKEGSSEKALANFGFNSWGEKYPPFDLDNDVPSRMSDELELESFDAPFILEGGSIDHNGDGLLITTESCLLNKNRNPELDKKTIEQLLSDWIGVEKIFWLDDGIVGDDTDGHVDDITRFVNHKTIVTVMEKKEHDENYEPLMKNRELLQDIKQTNGSSIEVIELPMPEPVVYKKDRLPASYANFTIANDLVLVPTFECEQDKYALGILKELFPNRKVIGLDCRMIVMGLGAIHCLTQQEPESIFN